MSRAQAGMGYLPVFLTGPQTQGTGQEVLCDGGVGQVSRAVALSQGHVCHIPHTVHIFPLEF